MPSPRSARRALPPVLVGLLAAVSVLGVPAQAIDLQRGWDDVDRATSDPTSYVAIIGDDDEWVTAGTRRLWRTDQTIEIGGSVDSRVVVRVGGDDWRAYELTFQPPEGETLTVGDYPDAGGVPVLTGRASLDISAEHRGCGPDAGDGEFTVHDITPDLSRLWLSFEVLCGAIGTVRGEVRIDSPPAETLTLTADELHWRASPPGRDYSTQPVFAVNTGDAPIVVGPAEITGAAFSLAGSSCGVLAPGASCAIEVAFDPLTRGSEDGLLRFTTSAADVPVVEVPLNGVGNVGNTHVYSRAVTSDGRVYDTNMTAAGGAFVARADARRVSIAFPHPDFVGELHNGRVREEWVTFAAAPGDRLEAGRTYIGTCWDESGVLLGLPGGCDTAATGTFTLDEFELRPDDTLARFRVRAAWMDPAYQTIATVAWQADEDATPYAPFLQLSGPSRLTQPGDVDLAATFAAGHGISTVDLYSATPQGRVPVESVRIDHGQSRVGLRARVEEDAVLVAEATTRDGVVLTSEPLTVAVDIPAEPGADPPAPTVSLTLRGTQARVVGRATSTRSLAELRLRPRQADRCLRLEVQRRVERRWVPRSLSGCRRTDRRGTATAPLVVRPGTTVRARAVWAGDRSRPPVASPWRTVRTRR